MTYLDVDAVLRDTLAGLEKSDKAVFDKFALPKLAGARDFATEAAETFAKNSLYKATELAREAGKTLSVDESKVILGNAYEKAFRRAATAKFAAAGYSGAAIANFGRNLFGAVGGGLKEIFTGNPAVAKPPGRISQLFAKAPNWLGNLAKNNQKTTAVVTIGGALAAGYAWMSGRENQRAEDEYAKRAREVMAMQQQAEMMEAQAAQTRGGNGYYGGVTAEEAAAIEKAQLKRSGGAGGGFAAAEMQRRAAAAMSQAPAAST